MGLPFRTHSLFPFLVLLILDLAFEISHVFCKTLAKIT